MNKIIDMKINKYEFKKTNELYNLLEEYEKEKNEDNKERISFYANYINDIQLISGNIGNLLALALETNHYISALYMIDTLKINDLNMKLLNNMYENIDITNLYSFFEFTVSYYDINEELENINVLKENNYKLYELRKKRILDEVKAIKNINEILEKNKRKK